MLIEGLPPDSHWAMAAQIAASSPETAAGAEADEEEAEEPEESDEEDDFEAVSSAFLAFVPLETMRLVGSVRVVDRTAETVTLPSTVSW